MLRPREGSRKAQIFDAFMNDGAKSAEKLATKLEIKASTLKSWTSEWSRKSGEGVTSSPVKRERLPDDKPRDNPKPGEFDPHFRYKSREEGERALIAHAKRAGIRANAFTVLENDGRFAIAPIHTVKKRPYPQFKKGDTVYGLFMVDSKAKVTGPGPEQSMIRYVKESSAKARPREECVPNYYLWLPSEIEDKPASKRERL